MQGHSIISWGVLCNSNIQIFIAGLGWLQDHLRIISGRSLDTRMLSHHYKNFHHKDCPIFMTGIPIPGKKVLTSHWIRAKLLILSFIELLNVMSSVPRDMYILWSFTHTSDILLHPVSVGIKNIKYKGSNIFIHYSILFTILNSDVWST